MRPEAFTAEQITFGYKYDIIRQLDNRGFESDNENDSRVQGPQSLVERKGKNFFSVGIQDSA